IHDSALVGRIIGVSRPRNHFPQVDAPRYLFIAGGIGITPILPMARHASRRGVPWRLVYGGRARRPMAFISELESLGRDKVELFPQDEVGMLDVDSIPRSASDDTAVYCCGPEGLIRAVERACQALLPPDALHVERFGAKAPSPAVLSELPAAPAGSFEVELRRTGCVLNVPPDR